MKKPWSITTTVRNPYRLRDFLGVLQQLEGSEWDSENQKKYQILLIQNRLYGYGTNQFYKGLSRDKVSLINDLSRDISLEEATDIFNEKDYVDPEMRGRQSMNPLKKMGAATVKHDKVVITDLGKLFLSDSFDLGEIFFKFFLKWQIPNPVSRSDYPASEGYDIKPFVASLHLINTVNQKEIEHGRQPKGVSKEEFSLFAPTLVHYQDIGSHANKIIDLRTALSGRTSEEKNTILRSYKTKFAREFLETSDKNKINKLLSTLGDYGDNAIRYFRLTRYVYIRGGGFYIDLESRRAIEIESLLGHDSGASRAFESAEEYLGYISDISQPQLPWETSGKYIEIIAKLIEELRQYENSLQTEKMRIKNYREMPNNELKNYIAELREYRRLLQEKDNQEKSQTVEQIESYIANFENIFNLEKRSILLEKLSALGLHALNDAERIQPNYPVGDDNEPTYTAPANTPDIECFYKDFNAICEVTMLTRREQWYHEGQPVMRHLRDFENEHGGKPCYCLFIAPSLHRDTINTFWNAIKYEYEGQAQKIIPLSIDNFVLILRTLLQMKNKGKFLNHSELCRLYNEILDSSRQHDNSGEWLQSIPITISSWGESLISRI
ncbi:MAG: AlwI family type II restriction endonuclease [Gammaproteobacteria bacterium]|nr:AlwI family type II restriction endonuclease [Gammaproteobacteria bacterium]